MSAFLHSTLLKTAGQDAIGKMAAWGLGGATVGGAYGYATDTGTMQGIGKGLLGGVGGAAALKYAGNKYATGVINAINDLDNVYDRDVINSIIKDRKFNGVDGKFLRDFHGRNGDNNFFNPDVSGNTLYGPTVTPTVNLSPNPGPTPISSGNPYPVKPEAWDALNGNALTEHLSKREAYGMMNNYFKDVTTVGTTFNKNMFNNRTTGVSFMDRINISQPIASLDGRINDITPFMSNKALRNEFANWQKDTFNQQPYSYSTMYNNSYFNSGEL